MAAIGAFLVTVVGSIVSNDSFYFFSRRTGWMDGWMDGRDPLAGVEDKMLKWNAFGKKRTSELVGFLSQCYDCRASFAECLGLLDSKDVCPSKQFLVWLGFSVIPRMCVSFHSDIL